MSQRKRSLEGFSPEPSCKVCGRRVRLDDACLVRGHYDEYGRCDGEGQEPVEMLFRAGPKAKNYEKEHRPVSDDALRDIGPDEEFLSDFD